MTAPIRYGCICSGISAPTLAAKPFGWQALFFSEIEKFPRAVLKHHYSDIPLHHDFTTIQKDTYGTVDALVGGTPCQSFSVAGKRLGLDDPRGNLALEYVALAVRLDALWLAFENVPGLLSSGKPAGEDFATFISAATGYEYSVPAGGWQNAGIADGKPDRWGIAWRVLDAQYFGVAQRRRRVFVIGYRGNWRPAAAVLLEPESLRGNPAPRREEGQKVAALTATGVGTCGADDNQAQAGHLLSHGFGGGNCSGSIDVAATLTAHGFAEEISHTLDRTQGPAIQTASVVRRLTPTECERLQGLPDNFTRIPWKKKPADHCPDGPRYKAIGNSMAVPCVRWIFERLDFVHHAILRPGDSHEQC
jgi:DNA (cytosine-5)-methyltransferase 1